MSAYIVGKRAGLGAAAGSISIFLPSEYANVYIYDGVYFVLVESTLLEQGSTEQLSAMSTTGVTGASCAHLHHACCLPLQAQACRGTCAPSAASAATVLIFAGTSLPPLPPLTPLLPSPPAPLTPLPPTATWCSLGLSGAITLCVHGHGSFWLFG